MAASPDLPEALLPFLGPWVREPEDPEETGIRQEVVTLLPDALGEDGAAVGVRMHARWQDADGNFGQVASSARLDGERVAHPLGGLETRGRLEADGPAVLLLEILEGRRVLQRLRWRLEDEGRELVAVMGARDADGDWDEREAVYHRAQVKQVLVYRRDLKMRKGKIAAQCAHASIAVFTRHDQGPADRMVVPLDGPMAWWTRRSMAKVVLSVETEEDLLKVHAEAKRRLLPTAVIRDAGKTEFRGVPTRTTVAVGPAIVDEIDPITGPGGLVLTKLA